MKARKMQTNPNIVQIASRLTEICSVYHLCEGTQVNPNIVRISPRLTEIRSV